MVKALAPGMMMCVTAAGAMRLLNRSRTTLWSYVKAGRLRSVSTSGNIAIPLVDIAGILDVTETQIYNAALAYKLPLLHVHWKGED